MQIFRKKLKFINLKALIVPAVSVFCFLSTTTTIYSKSIIEKMTSSENSKSVPARNSLFAPSSSSLDPFSLKRHSIGFALGQTFLKGSFQDYGHNKILPEIYYNYSVSHSFDLIANFHASNHRSNSQSIRVLGITTAIKAKAFHFDSFAPYVFAGLGFYSPKAKFFVNNNREIFETNTKTVFGTNFGIGADLDLNKKFNAGFLLHAHDPFDIHLDNAPKIEGFYLKLLMTLFYKI